jgi:peptidyl-prolyl cis-trans isomerase C
MKRTLLALALAAATLPLVAQTDGDKLVARINGKELTNRDIDALWNRIPKKMQEDYVKSGGKLIFVQNYIAKHLIVQDAIRSGFAAKIGAPDELDAAGEAMLFDRYVREIIAAPLVSEEEMKRVYQENTTEFVAPEQGSFLLLRVLKKDSTTSARESIEKAMIEIFSARTQLAQTYSSQHLPAAMRAKFAEVARRMSDAPSAEKGGDMGWVALHTVDPKIADAVRTMKPGTASGIIETADAFQMIFVDEHRPAGVEAYEAVKPALRQFIMAREAKKVMDAVAKKSAELRKTGKVEIFAQNLR